MRPDITKLLEDKVKKTIEERALLKENQHIVIGLSGGPDSVCLFNVLMSLKRKMNLSVYPVHVNHKFRPGAAEEDQKFVEELCRKNGLNCSSYVVDCNELAKKEKMTSEEAGRKARYDAFYDVAEKISLGANPSDVKIAVAQNANDQAETVLFRLMRGTGVDGLAGIAYERKERGYSVIRPLLDVYRDEIEEYCNINGLNPVTDHTNSEAVYARNKIRLNLIPMIEAEYNSNILRSMVRLSKIAGADKEYLWQQAEELYKKIAEEKLDKSTIIMDRQILADTHKAIRHRVLLKAFSNIGLDSDISEERITAADKIIEKKQAPKSVEFPRGYVLEVAKGQVIVKVL